MAEIFGTYWTKKFTDIWEDASSFVADTFTDNPLVNPQMSQSDYTQLYYLLYARYGNSSIANFDENQFKFKVSSIIFQYGGIWKKEVAIQRDLLTLDGDNLLKGTVAIYNHSYNPSTSPSTSTLNELTTIDDQNTTNYRKSKMDAYTQLLGLIDEDITKKFLDKFKNLFIKIVEPQEPLLYESAN